VFRARNCSVLVASVRGAAHERAGAPCQDAYAIAQHASGRILAAISDGAGSASRSHIGAQAAVQAAVGKAAELLDSAANEESPWDQQAHAIIAAAGAAVAAAASAAAVEPRELACTLTILVADEDSLALAQVGDGAVVSQAGGDCERVGAPDGSEYLNETCFVTNSAGDDCTRTSLRRGRWDGVAMLTDGIEPFVFENGGVTPFADFFAPVFSGARDAVGTEAAAALQLFEMLSANAVQDRTCDDITLVILTDPGPEGTT
jgi:hypothetical protein